MASIFLFCDLPELRDWIITLCQHENLGILYFGRTEGIGQTVPHADFVLTDDIYQVFLFPIGNSNCNILSINDVRQREWGWINIRPGGVKNLDSNSCLVLSEIHGEKSELPTGNPDKWVRWLKKIIKLHVSVGVVGKNVITGGTSNYKDILYTKKAVESLSSGILWKQFLDGNAIFEPEA